MGYKFAGAAAAAAILMSTSLAAATDDAVGGVVTDTIEHELTTAIHVWAPDAAGAYPIAFALHGTGVDFGRDWDVIGSALAREGIVTFAPDYHASDWKTGDLERVTREAECGYRYARQVADRYGGNLDEPVIFMGHSIGGTYALTGGLGIDRFGPSGDFDECFEGVPRPELIVPISGCHVQAAGMTFDPRPAVYGSGDATVLFVGAEHDNVCPAWQSVEASEAFSEAGLDATSLVIPDATHMSLLGHEVVDDEWVTLLDDPAASAVVDAITEAVDRLR